MKTAPVKPTGAPKKEVHGDITTVSLTADLATFRRKSRGWAWPVVTARSIKNCTGVLT
jgi:hypothetical protein